MFIRFMLLLISLALIIPSVVSAQDNKDPMVEFFNPEGTVKGVRQAAARFSVQMVSFGDLRAEDPFVMDCPATGKGRWADGRNWIYDFDSNLPAGVVCKFTLKPGIKGLDGRNVTGRTEFGFSTGGPAIIRSDPYEGRHLDEEQIFILKLDADAVEESIVKNASCVIDQTNERMGIKIIKDGLRDEILKSRYRGRVEGLGPIVLLQCGRRLPNSKAMGLVWGKGITSISGVATTEDQKLAFYVRDPFKAEFSCMRENPDAGCVPLGAMGLYFNAPLKWETAQKITLKNNQKTYTPLAPKEPQEYVNNVEFAGPLPEKTEFLIALPENVIDDAGRPLSNQDKFPLKVRTDQYPPLAKFAANFGVIEKDSPLLPLSVRNIEPNIKTRLLELGEARGLSKGILGRIGSALSGDLSGKAVKIDGEARIIDWINKVRSSSWGEYESRSKALLGGVPDVKDISVPKPNGPSAFEVIGINLGGPGFYVVEVESLMLGRSLLGKPQPMFVSSSALVTDLGVHFKWGRESSLVWVSKLSSASPVAGANIKITDCKGAKLWEGMTGPDGTAMIKSGIPLPNDYQCSNDSVRGMFVFAKTSDDMAFVNTEWEEGIEAWRFNLPTYSYNGVMALNSIIDRGLYRAGETVHMKHVMRKKTMAGFAYLRPDELPRAVLIRHEGSDEKYTFPLTWDAINGIAETIWKIPETAKLGVYSIVLLKDPKSIDRYYYDYGRDAWQGGTFRVEEFKVPLMKGSIKPPDEPVVAKTEFDVDLMVMYMAGGGAAGLDVKLRSKAAQGYASFADFENFNFSNGEVKEGIAGRYSEYDYDYEYLGEGSAYGEQQAQPGFKTQEIKLDQSGGARVKITDIPLKQVPQDVMAELEYMDPNGRIQTVAGSARVWPANVLVGVLPDSWASTEKSFKFKAAASDIKGKPAANVDISIELFKRKWYTHRKRLVGGFYSYEHTQETKKIGTVCTGKTNQKGLLLCEMKSPVTGEVILQASAMDNEGRETKAYTSAWISGEDTWFDVGDSDRIDVLPEKKRYEPGERARFQVRMPFKEATALITVEREGVMDTYVRKISIANPVVEIPVKQNYAPNVFVSVLCVRGRVGDVKPTALVDLGRPAHKLGIAEINVGWKNHELKVKVTPDKDTYKVRGKASVTINVRRSDGSALNKPGEVALAAVDEGLLELMPNNSWNLLEAMMMRRSYEVNTSTAQMHIVGRRHFGLKALPSGGGGGEDAGTRELFDTLLLWKGRVMLDQTGSARVEIPLNDSLTSFRIVAIATSGADMFGTGHASIRTTQDLMMFSGLSPVIREGDKYKAGFTVRNASSRPLDVSVSAKLLEGAGMNKPEGQSINLAPGEAGKIWWDMIAPIGASAIKWEVRAADKSGTATDAIKASQKVIPVEPVRVFQATLLQLDKQAGMKVERPVDAVKGRGGIRLLLASSIAGDKSGIEEYMKRYPYTCMEQKVSKAVSLRDESMWKEIMAILPNYLDANGLLKYFPTCRRGDPALTAYVLSIAHEAGWRIPENSQERMIGGLRGFVDGSIYWYSGLPTADLSIRKMNAVEALSRYMNIDQGLISSITIEPNLWPTSAVIDWHNVLTRTKALKDRDAKLDETKRIIRSRLNFQGTTMGFSTEGMDYMWWLMVSTDLNAIKSVLALMDDPAWREDVPRMMRGSIGRQHRGHWDLTLANAWGVLSMEKFASKFESEKLAGLTNAALNEDKKSHDWGVSPKSGSMLFNWPENGKADLSMMHEQSGKPWVTVQSMAAIPLKESLSSGFKIKKSVSPVIQKEKGMWSVGDVVRIKIEVDSQSDMTWVVVNDPVPAGASVLGTGLGRDSRLMTLGERGTGWAWPIFQERAFDSFKAYYEYVAKGNWSLEYTIRLNTPGDYELPETRVEALYSPEMFGELPNENFVIRQ